jgi:hypothetical protein
LKLIVVYPPVVKVPGVDGTRVKVVPLVEYSSPPAASGPNEKRCLKLSVAVSAVQAARFTAGVVRVGSPPPASGSVLACPGVMSALTNLLLAGSFRTWVIVSKYVVRGFVASSVQMR